MNLASPVQGSQVKDPGFGSDAKDVATWFLETIAGVDGVHRRLQEEYEEGDTTSKHVQFGDGEGDHDTSPKKNAAAEEGSQVHHAGADGRDIEKPKQAAIDRFTGWWGLALSKNPNTAKTPVRKDSNGTALLISKVHDGPGDKLEVRHFNGKKVNNPENVETVMKKNAKIIEPNKLAMTWERYDDPDVFFTLGANKCGNEAIHLKEETDQTGGAKRTLRESYWVFHSKADHEDGDNVLLEYCKRFKQCKDFDAANDAACSTTPVCAGGSDGRTWQVTEEQLKTTFVVTKTEWDQW